jgi:tetratricopeptide (TPR) repeat protein
LFFKTSVIASMLLLFKGFSDLSNGVARIESYMGNPAFFAGYLLFSITSALIVIKESKDKFWQYFSGAVALLSIVSIFLTETRGTLLGLFVGLIVTMFFLIFTKEKLTWKGFNLKKIFSGLLVFGIIFSAVFVFTRHANFWDNIPGVSRIADISLEDDTTRSRLLVWQMSIDSVNPKNENIKKTLLGWGLENSFFALDKYYDPLVWVYDSGYIDRSHNKFFDVLVMMGVVGLFSYLAIWFFFFRNIFRERSVASGVILFFGTSFLVHLMFLFDQMPTSVALYSMFAFALFYFNQNKASDNNLSIRSSNIVYGFLVTIIALNVFVFFSGTVPAYAQSRQYLRLTTKSSISEVNEKISDTFSPFTSAQMYVKDQVMFLLRNILSDKEKFSANQEDVNEIFDKTILGAEEYMQRRPKDYRFLSAVSNLYYQKALTLNDGESLKIAEKYLRGVLEYVPNRPTLIRGLVVNLTNQDRYEEASLIIEDFLENNYDIPEFYYDYGYIKFLNKDFESALIDFEKAFDMKPVLFKDEGLALNVRIYGTLLENFYKKRDKEKFIQISERLKGNEYHASESLDYLIGEIEKGIWPNIDFK